MDISLDSSVVEYLISDAEDSRSSHIFSYLSLYLFIPPIPTSFGAMAFLDTALIVFDKSRQGEYELYLLCVS